MPDSPSNTSYRRILAVDTSTMVQSVAVLDAGDLLAERLLRAQAGHSGVLLSAISGTLDDLDMQWADLDLLAIGAGPGSFTGLRIGLASLKGIAFATDLPLYPVSSLAAMARDVILTGGLVVPSLDARRGEVYAGLYRRAPKPSVARAVVTDRAFSPEALIEAILEHHKEEEPVVMPGTGSRTYREVFDEKLRPVVPELVILGSHHLSPRAGHLAAIAYHEARSDEIPPLATLEPNYQRLSQAELSWKRREEKS